MEEDGFATKTQDRQNQKGTGTSAEEEGRKRRSNFDRFS